MLAKMSVKWSDNMCDLNLIRGAVWTGCDCTLRPAMFNQNVAVNLLARVKYYTIGYHMKSGSYGELGLLFLIVSLTLEITIVFCVCFLHFKTFSFPVSCLISLPMFEYFHTKSIFITSTCFSITLLTPPLSSSACIKALFFLFSLFQICVHRATCIKIR